MTVELSGQRLTLDEVVRVARAGETVALTEETLSRMRERRAVVERVAQDGTRTYGVTTGVGMRRDATVDTGEDARAFNRSAIFGHLVGLGSPAPDDVVRASLLRLANGVASGHQGARPEVAEALVETLNEGGALVVRSLGTVGQADLAQNADLAHGALGELELEAGEAIALLVSNAFSTGQAALAVADARSLLEWIDAAAALDFEALRGNVGALHPAVGAARPYPGIGETLTRMHELLESSGLWEPDAARFLQDPLTFRCVPQVHGAARDSLRFVEEQLAIELNAHQGNPLVVLDEQRLVSVGNFDSQPLAAALDLLRIALAPVLTAAVERTLKLLSPRFSGLSEGLVASEGSWQDGLSELGVAAQAIAAEARLLAQPVSFELASTMQESGVEDRTALSSLGARRVVEMLDLGASCHGRRADGRRAGGRLLRGPRLGTGAALAHGFVRERVPRLESHEQMPLPLEQLATDIRALPPPA
jgi:histidine ammonia-lyase